jgi:hypothetical protein
MKASILALTPFLTACRALQHQVARHGVQDAVADGLGLAFVEADLIGADVVGAHADVLALALKELARLAGHGFQVDEVVREVPALGGLTDWVAHPETSAVLTHRGEWCMCEPSIWI